MSARHIHVVLLAILCLAASALTVAAGTNLNSSKSNLYRPAGTPVDQAACRSVNGTLATNDAGQKVCVNPVLPAGWSEKQLPSCETCNRLCPGVCFMHVEGGCICFYDPLRSGG